MQDRHGCRREKEGWEREVKDDWLVFKAKKNFQRESEVISGVTAVKREALTGDGGGIVGGVSPQVLGGLGGWLWQALRTAAVTHTGGGIIEQRRSQWQDNALQ